MFPEGRAKERGGEVDEAAARERHTPNKTPGAMATETEDVLGELYGWDSTIEDVFALSENDPKRDEDDALDAYEEIIQVASRPNDGADPVLSLAAQLLTKHFFKFPHVHLNVIDVMLALCSAQRSLAVRIHTIRSLMQIVKTPLGDKEPLASECVDRIQDVITKLVAKETASVIVRHMSELGKALKERRAMVAQIVAVAESKQPKEKEQREMIEVAESKSAKKKSAKAEKLKKKADRAAEKKADRAAEKEKEREAKKKKTQLLGTTSTFSSALRAVQEEAGVAQEQQPSTDRERLKQLRRTSSEDYVDKDTVKGSRDDHRSVVDVNVKGSRDDRHSHKEEEVAPVRRDSDERRSRIEALLAVPPDQPKNSPTNAGGFNPQNCPPGPYLFIGNLPNDLRNSDIVAYLAEVDPSLTTQNVQIKYPNRLNTSGYAFVGLSTTRLAREAIRFVRSVKLRGRAMEVNFARGPPCHILSFVERSGKGRSMEDVDAVRDFNFAKVNRTVWERLCNELRKYGELEELGVGKVRFDSLDAAKDVIRNQHLTVEGYEIIPIYEPEEQLKNNGTRRYVKPQPHLALKSPSAAARQSFSLKSGRVVGDLNEENEVLPASEQATESRSEKRDWKSDERKNRKRSPSPKIDERRGRKRSASPLMTNERKTRERTPSPLKKKRGSSNNNPQHSRSRSLSPAPMKSKQQKQREARGRRSGSHSRSPAASSRNQITHGRSKSRSVSPVVSKKQLKPRKHSPSRSRSPAAPAPARKQKSQAARSRSRSVSPAAFRKKESHHRSKSPQSQNRKQDLDYEDVPVKKQNRADRSRSPIVVKECNAASHSESSPALLPMPIDSRGPPGRAQPFRKSRSRSGERERGRVPRDMSSYGPSRQEDGGKQPQERERNQRDNKDQPRERSRPRPERQRKSDVMSRYGPAPGADIMIERTSNNNNGGRNERRNDHQALKREYRDSPPQPLKESILGNHVQGPPRSEQRRGSRSPPRNEQRPRSPPRFGGDRNRSKSPQSRRPLIDAPSQRAPPGDTGGRGGREREQQRPPLERKSSGSRRDDRSIAEIAHEEQERIDRLQQQHQQSRRDSHPPKGGNLSKYGDAGRGDHFGTPPPPRDGGGRPRGGSFQKPRSRSRSPPGRPMQPIQQRANDFTRDRNHQSPMMPPHARDINRGFKNSPQFDHQLARGNNSMRDSPSFEHQRRGYNVRRDPPPLDLPKHERRESDGGRFERRGRSPLPSPLMAANDRRAPPAPTSAGERRRSRSNTRGRANEREREQERKDSRRSEKDSRALNDQNNRNRANDQGNDRRKERQQQPDSPVLPTPQTGKRLRSQSPPSPVLRDNHRAKVNRERNRSPILKRPVAAAGSRNGNDAPAFAEKKRRIDDDDDFVLPKPASSAVFDDMDEMMVDYEEDD